MINDFSFVPKHYAARTHAEMKDVLMDPNAKGPEIHYYMIRGGKNQKKYHGLGGRDGWGRIY